MVVWALQHREQHLGETQAPPRKKRWASGVLDNPDPPFTDDSKETTPQPIGFYIRWLLRHQLQTHEQGEAGLVRLGLEMVQS